MSSDPDPDPDTEDDVSSGSETNLNEESSRRDTRGEGTAASTQDQRTHGRESGGAGEAAGRALDSARNRLSTPAAKSQLKSVIGLFALVGAGFGVTGFLILTLLGGGGGLGAQLITGLF